MKKWTPWFIGLGITSLVVFSYWFFPSSLRPFELMYQNAHFRLRGPLAPGPEVVIAAIDEKSIDELGRWPWPRKTLTQLVDKLVERQARVIGFDMVFSSPDESSGIQNLWKMYQELQTQKTAGPKALQTIERYIKESDYDAQFAEVLGNSRRAVLGYFFHFQPQGLGHLSAQERHQFFNNIKPAQFIGFIKEKKEVDLSAIEFRSAFAVESNIPVLSKAVKEVGFISIDVEDDRSIRKLPLIVKYHDSGTRQDYFFPPLSVRVLEKYLEGTLLFRVGSFGVETVLLDGEYPLEFLTNEKGEMLINFMGAGGTFPHYSVSDIINDRMETVPPGSLKDKIVLIGATAPGLENIKLTPFDSAYPGVEIHATLIDNILHKNSLYQPEWTPLADSAYLVMLGLFLTGLYTRIRPAYGILAWVFTAIAQFYFSQWMFVNKKMWMSDIFPFLENTLILASLLFYRYTTEVKQKQHIQNVFTKYLSSTVIDQLIKDPARLKLGGEQKELTALFTDIAGFTTFSEQMTPEDLVNHLNAYLTEMTNILFKYEGTLDKYDGDAIKAFFGAPLFFEEHARRACWVGIEMQDRLRQLRQQWKEEGKPELRMRVGINTGQMVVGNMGSKNRMNYGINGDSVNLAARLESVNKEYGTECLISDSTYQQAREHVVVREMDSIRVMGRATPVKVYELMGKAGCVDENILDMLPVFQEGLRHYRKRNWQQAVAYFEKVLEMFPEDGPSQTFKNRCLEFEKNPPSEVWDGVFPMSSK